jgi:hypothetical protein
MTINRNKNPERRGFLVSSLRMIVLGIIAGIAGFLGIFRRDMGEGNSRCLIDTPCGNCIKLAYCSDQKAEKSKKGSSDYYGR